MILVRIHRSYSKCDFRRALIAKVQARMLDYATIIDNATEKGVNRWHRDL